MSIQNVRMQSSPTVESDRRVTTPLLSTDWLGGCMAAVRGATQRTGVSDAIFLGVRVLPVNFAKLDRVAAARRISKAAIVDELLAQMEDPTTDQEELPLTRSA
jgi:hypothetical protein